MTPLCFLVLPLPTKENKRYLYVTGSLGGFILIYAAATFLYPQLMADFSLNVDRTLGDPESRGLWNPSSFALIRDLAYRSFRFFGGEVGSRGPFIVYGIVGTLMAWMTFRALRRVRMVSAPDSGHRTICLLALLYLLLVPRLQIYSYILALPPAFHLLKRRAASSVYPLSLFFLMSLSAKDVFFPGMKEFYDFFWDYSPFLAVFVVWAIDVISPLEANDPLPEKN